MSPYERRHYRRRRLMLAWSLGAVGRKRRRERVRVQAMQSIELFDDWAGWRRDFVPLMRAA